MSHHDAHGHSTPTHGTEHGHGHGHGSGHGHHAPHNPRVAFPYNYETPPTAIIWRRVAYAFTFSYFFWFFCNHRDLIRRMGHFKTWEVRTGPQLIDIDDWEKDAEEKVYISPDKWTQPLSVSLSFPPRALPPLSTRVSSVLTIVALTLLTPARVCVQRKSDQCTGVALMYFGDDDARSVASSFSFATDPLMAEVVPSNRGSIVRPND